MSHPQSRALPAALPKPTANEKLKSRWRAAFWIGTTLGVGAHAALAVVVPGLRLDAGSVWNVSDPVLPLRAITVADVDFTPDAPADVAVPELPTVPLFELDIDLESSLELPDFSAFDDLELSVSPPIRTSRDEWLDYKAFAPYVVRPEIRNRSELKWFLQTHYQRIFEYSGATGVVQVTFWVNETGAVEKAEILESSGVRSLDRLALRLSRVLRFRPAMMAGRPIRILVHVPITFRAA